LKVTTAIILAGGLGTRLRSTVPDLPKPMAPIGGRPFLECQLDYWIAQGITLFVLSVGYRYEVITDHFGSNFKGAAIDYVIEREPLGTGGGLLLAAQKMSNELPFLLLNGDTYFEVDLKALNEFSLRNEADCSFSLFCPNEIGRYMGMEVSPKGQVISLKSSRNLSHPLANGGVYWVRSQALLLDEFTCGDKISLEDDIFPACLASGKRLFGLEFPGKFIDIGVPDDYRRAQDFLE